MEAFICFVLPHLGPIHTFCRLWHSCVGLRPQYSPPLQVRRATSDRRSPTAHSYSTRLCMFSAPLGKHICNVNNSTQTKREKTSNTISIVGLFTPKRNTWFDISVVGSSGPEERVSETTITAVSQVRDALRHVHEHHLRRCSRKHRRVACRAVFLHRRRRLGGRGEHRGRCGHQVHVRRRVMKFSRDVPRQSVVAPSKIECHDCCGLVCG